MSIKQKCYSIFGKKLFNHALFYDVPGGLRFELSESGTYIEMFSLAWKKANEIFDFLLNEKSDLHICFRCFGDLNFLSLLSFFRSLRSCELTISKDCEHWFEKVEEEGDVYYNHFFLQQCSYKEVKQALWGCLAADIGIEPRLFGDVYIIDLDNRLLIHPYDDRGMDIIGPNKPRLQEVYQRFNNYLHLPVREFMDASFSS